MSVVTKFRKSDFLSPSGLRCLADLPTVNVSAGCGHRCVYCYTKGYSVYPGDDVVEVYADMAGRISVEVGRKRNKPNAVYFCPSCDPFQPVKEVQQSSFEVMRMLLCKGIGVQFVTKGRIAEDILQLFEKHSGLVCGQFGLTTVDDNIRKIVEPNTATVEEKLRQLKRLCRVGVKMSVRCDPLIHGVMDSEQQIEEMFRQIVLAGCKEVAVSYLFLRPAITKSIRENISDKALLEMIFEPYSKGIRLPIGIKSSNGVMLPTEIRRAAFIKMREIAARWSISIHICGCKNCDLTSEYCYISRLPRSDQGLLF